MVIYTTLSAVQLPTYLTGSEYVRNFLSSVQQSYATQHAIRPFPSFPGGTEVFYDNTITVPSSSRYCVVRNPYQRFVARWVRNSRARTKHNTTPYTFTEYVTDYNNNHFVVPLSLNGLWENHTSNHIDFGPISSQLTAAGLTTSDVKILRFETIADDVKTISHVDLTNVVQLSSYTKNITNGALTLAEDPNWKSQYNQTTADIVYNAFAGDFAAFGYSRDSWK